MSEQPPASIPAPSSLPENPNLDWLRKQAKRRLDALRQERSDACLADAQFVIAKEYGFPSWRALKAHIDALTVDGQLFNAARSGDVAKLTALLDEHPDKLNIRDKPYEWTLLHAAASEGQVAVVEWLLSRGLDVNARERGDHTYALHWAAAAGHLDVVRTLAEAGGDVVGHGDDHELEVIGWATCWDGCDDAKHRAVAEFLIERGAPHHIFSAIAMNLPDEVRRIVAENPSALNRRMSRNEDHQLPLHFAVRMNRPAMVALLLELGADPLATDRSGYAAAVYATAPGVDLRVMESIRAMTVAELSSAERGKRRPRITMMDLVALLALRDWESVAQLMREPAVSARGGPATGLLHVMAKRGDATAVRWLLDRGTDPNAHWSYGDADLTPLHFAIMSGHLEMVRILIEAGADPGIRDSEHDGNAMDWATYFRRTEIVEFLRDRAGR